MNLDPFFNPRSVAIVGAAREKGKVGYEILRNLVAGGFPGTILPVNPKAAVVEGLACYPDVRSLPQTPDLAVIAVPARFVEEVLQQCAGKGVKAVIIITAGFKETGEDGRKAEQRLAALARDAGMRVMGPNCLGVMVPAARLNASFGGDLPNPGGIAFLSQSGALMSAILDMANASGIGFSKLVSIGNKADINEMDLIEALAEDPDTRVIAGYLESINDGAAFVAAAERVSREKPILLMKAGGTTAGARAASSHTGSLAGGETAYEAAFERAGIIRCRSMTHQFDFARALACQPLPKGPRVAIVTNAGGPGIMAADAVEREGLAFAQLTDGTRRALAGGLPAAASIHNPVDVLGDAPADRYEFAVRAVVDDPNVDAVLVLLTPQAVTACEETAEALARVSRATPGKPLLTSFMGALKVAKALDILRQARIPNYGAPEDAARTLRVMAEYAAWRARPPGVVRRFDVRQRAAAEVIAACLREGRREIGEAESKRILECYGFRTPRAAAAATAEEAVRAADGIGYPVVMKIVSADILHKSDVGGVRLGLPDAAAVRRAYAAMMEQVPKLRPQARLSGVSIQEMCRRAGDQEVILGVKRDPGFGPLLMFGLGGVLVEVLKDVAFALAPLTESDARALVRRVRSYPLLEGVRGQPGVDMDALVEGLLRLSQLVSDFPPIRELDINPLVVRPAGHPPVAVDARISVEADPRRRDPDAGLRPGENGAHDARPQAQSTSSDSCLKAK